MPEHRSDKEPPPVLPHDIQKSGYRWFLDTCCPASLLKTIPAIPMKVELHNGLESVYRKDIHRWVPCHMMEYVGIWGPWIEMPQPSDFPGLDMRRLDYTEDDDEP